MELSVQGSEVDLGDGDFLEVINYKDNLQNFPPISGQRLTHAQYNIPETDFLMVFTSDRDSRQGKGFKLQIECPTLKQTTPDNDDEEEDLEESVSEELISSGDDE